jgi:hypothetical protein
MSETISDSQSTFLKNDRVREPPMCGVVFEQVHNGFDVCNLIAHNQFKCTSRIIAFIQTTSEKTANASKAVDTNSGH